jgi:hypothetical protein
MEQAEGRKQSAAANSWGQRAQLTAPENALAAPQPGRKRLRSRDAECLARSAPQAPNVSIQSINKIMNFRRGLRLAAYLSYERIQKKPVYMTVRDGIGAAHPGWRTLDK